METIQQCFQGIRKLPRCSLLVRDNLKAPLVICRTGVERAEYRRARQALAPPPHLATPQAPPTSTAERP